MLLPKTETYQNQEEPEIKKHRNAMLLLKKKNYKKTHTTKWYDNKKTVKEMRKMCNLSPKEA